MRSDHRVLMASSAYAFDTPTLRSITGNARFTAAATVSGFHQ